MTGKHICDDLSKENEYQLDIYAETEIYEEKNMFLLREDAVKHLENNRHRYSDTAHVYCQHAWRCPEQEEFLKALGEKYFVPEKEKGE